MGIMVQTRSQQIGDNPENIIPLIQRNNNEIVNPAGGLAIDQCAGGTQIFRGLGHSRDERTHTTSPVDSNFSSRDVASET